MVLTCPPSTAPLSLHVSFPAISFLPRRSLRLGLRRWLIGLRLNGKRIGRSDRAHDTFHRAGDLLEDLACISPAVDLRSEWLVSGTGSRTVIERRVQGPSNKPHDVHQRLIVGPTVADVPMAGLSFTSELRVTTSGVFNRAGFF